MLSKQSCRHVFSGTTLFCTFLLFTLCFSERSCFGQEKTFVLQEIEDVLPNPYKGFAMRCGYEHPIYDTKLQYTRYTWQEVEPERGVIDFDYMEKDWGDIEKTGKLVGFRIMAVLPQGTDYYVRFLEPGNKLGTVEERVRTYLDNGEGHYDIPDWLVDEGVHMIEYTITGEKGGSALSPDYSDPKFLSAHRDFILALGARYDKDPRVAWIDIGTYGFWGEQHFGYRGRHRQLEASDEIKRTLLEHYYEGFPTKPKVVTFDTDYGIHYVTERGGGLRNDCLGVQYTEYLDAVGDLNETAWKLGFINGEFCGNVNEFIAATSERFEDVYDFIQETHWSFVTFKLCQAGGNIAPVNEEHRRKLDMFYKKLGYRFVLRQVRHNHEVKKGGTLRFTVNVENTGVAPFYFPWPLVVYLCDEKGTAVFQQTLDTDIRTWLPGEHSIVADLSIPNNITSGDYFVKLAIHDPAKNKPAILFANTGQDSQGRYEVSQITVL